ncbi:P-loop containing nucleoside triphosphate hydrolase protein [Pterulicium gracile]|uniref:P-loop containing nucleoside triphosphate hydrolase protein n=1 Tax=Pterulicium gracile TaxID=1884261 RepID=A0A5C3QCF1_9AGAR|nr:P-loop containing nucleoside triphosphate hydrolase protein [Pterula gracilis]
MLAEENTSVKPSDAFLEEISTESLQSLLTSLRRRTVSLGKTHLQRTDAEPSAHFPTCLRPGDVLELQGPPGSGKTHLLYHLIITCVLPTSLQGWGKIAAVYDLEHTFSIRRFRQLLQFRIDSAASPITNIQDIAAACLSRVKLFLPTSSTQLAVSILHLPMATASHPTDDELGLIAVDSLSTFYWSDRFTSEHQDNHTRNPLYHILTAIKSILRTHSPVFVYTNWALYPATARGNQQTSAFFRNHLKPSSKSSDSNSSSRTEINAVLPLAYHITLARSVPPIPDQFPSRATLSGRVRAPESPMVSSLVLALEEDANHSTQFT